MDFSGDSLILEARCSGLHLWRLSILHMQLEELG